MEFCEGRFGKRGVLKFITFIMIVCFSPMCFGLNLGFKSLPVENITAKGSAQMLQTPLIAVNPMNVFKIGDLKVSLGKFQNENIKISVEGNKAVLTNEQTSKELIVETVVYGTGYCVKMGNCAYIVRDQNQIVDISCVNPLGNFDYVEFFDLNLADIDPADISYALPVENPEYTKQLDLFPVNKIQQPELLAKPIEPGVIDNKAENIAKLFAEGSACELFHNLAAIGMSGKPKYYYKVQEILNKLFKMNRYQEYKDIIIGLSDMLYFSDVGCDWLKWQELGKQRRQKSKESKTAVTRTPTLFEEPVSQACIGEDDPENWEIQDIKILGKNDLEYIPTENVELGQKAIDNAEVVSVAFGGGGANTVKQKIGLHKLIHKALKVIVEIAGQRITKWISIIQARIGVIFGQNPKSQIVVVTSSDGPVSGESDKSVRELLEECYSSEIEKNQINIAKQRTGLVLDPDTGYPLRFDNGRTATYAENHLLAFIAVLMDKNVMMNILKNTSGVISIGNGDNILNNPRAGMVDRILKARNSGNGKSVATVATFALSAGDKKGGIATEITYYNRVTGATKVRREIREMSSFPTRNKAKLEDGGTGWTDSISLKGEEQTEFYKKCEEKGWFIEDLIKDDQPVPHNIAFYTMDMLLYAARIFGLNERDKNVIEKLGDISQIEWSRKIRELVLQVPATQKLDKSVSNEDDTCKVIGFLTDQPVQAFGTNSLGLLGGDVVADFLLTPNRADVFLPYKGTDQNVIAEDGTVLTNRDYDLIANMQLYRRFAREDQHPSIVTGEGEKVVDIIPVTLEEVIEVNKQAENVNPRVPAASAKLGNGNAVPIVKAPLSAA